MRVRLSGFSLAGFFLAGLLLTWTAAAVPAQGQETFRGWERDSAYNKQYTTQNSDSLRGKIERLYELTPVPGMSKGVALTLRAGSKLVTVHLGPRASLEYLFGALAPGDGIRITGAWAKVGGEAVLMAAKFRREESLEVKLRRTRDGAPYWTLSAQERLEEKLEE
jgi:hypothetical protein